MLAFLVKSGSRSPDDDGGQPETANGASVHVIEIHTLITAFIRPSSIHSTT
jgi:hypothetical protein